MSRTFCVPKSLSILSFVMEGQIEGFPTNVIRVIMYQKVMDGNEIYEFLCSQNSGCVRKLGIVSLTYRLPVTSIQNLTDQTLFRLQLLEYRKQTTV